MIACAVPAHACQLYKLGAARMLVVQFLGRAAWQGMEARRDIAENLAIRMPMLAAVLDVVLDAGLQARRRILEKDLDFMMA